MLSAISTGGQNIAYRHGGYNRYTMRELLAPIEQTFVLCGMEYLPPFCVHGSHGMQVEEIDGYAREYRRAVEALRDERLAPEVLRAIPILNEALDAEVGGAD